MIEGVKTPVKKRCNVQAVGCHVTYNMNYRVASQQPLRYDACDNENCQKKKHGIQGFYMPKEFYNSPGGSR